MGEWEGWELGWQRAWMGEVSLHTAALRCGGGAMVPAFDIVHDVLQISKEGKTAFISSFFCQRD